MTLVLNINSRYLPTYCCKAYGCCILQDLFDLINIRFTGLLASYCSVIPSLFLSICLSTNACNTIVKTALGLYTTTPLILRDASMTLLTAVVAFFFNTVADMPQTIAHYRLYTYKPLKSRRYVNWTCTNITGIDTRCVCYTDSIISTSYITPTHNE